IFSSFRPSALPVRIRLFQMLDQLALAWLGPGVQILVRMRRGFGVAAMAVALAAGGVFIGANVLGQAAMGDRAAAQAVLADLAKAPPDRASRVKAPLDQAKSALDRADGARASGDVAHAAELEGLAREWAETARDLLRASDTEADAGATEAALRTANTQAERNRALVEEAIARKMRATAELEQLEAISKGGDSGRPT